MRLFILIMVLLGTGCKSTNIYIENCGDVTLDIEQRGSDVDTDAGFPGT
ncbi:MAG: hypothetical protein HRU26_08945 [Psychroserpens sp.]|nr:hypothetical protein [Psychroserpens sp.]